MSSSSARVAFRLGQARVLCLTFDDGPDPIWTPPVLEMLERCRVRGTFFMVGEQVVAEPDLARVVLAAGHDVELHCHRHIRHTELTERELQLDTESALAALASVGVRPRLWRPPWGISTRASVRIAERLGLRLVRWSIDTHDWRGDPPEVMLDHVRPRVADGGSVLMHDALGPGAGRGGCHNTLVLLPSLAAGARGHGLRLLPMRHVLPGLAAASDSGIGAAG